MFAAAVIATVFAVVLATSWLSSRAEAARSRCDEHLRHIRRHLDVPPSSADRHPDRPGPPASG